MKFKKILVASLVLIALSGMLYAQGYNKSIVAYGAKADADFLNTNIIQKAIDDASGKGSGTVVIPKGTFLTGTIILKSGVNLHLDEGAVLAGSVKRKDYDNKLPALIIAQGQHDIAITGAGTMHGRGTELIKDILQVTNTTGSKRPPEGARTNLVHFVSCSNISVKGVTFRDATSWVTHYEHCNNLTIDSVKIESVAYWNNDGIDINNCKQVRITNCNINTADDAICLKSESSVKDSCSNIYIANCRLRSSANAFKMGTGSKGGFRNITVRNLDVYDTYRSAVAIESVDGGFLENVDVQNVVAKNTGNAILVRLGHRNKDSSYSTVKNIHIANMQVEVPVSKPDKGYPIEGPLLRYPPGITPAGPGKFESVSPWNDRGDDPAAIRYNHNVFPSSVTGLPGHPVQNVLLENISITYEGGADKDIAYLSADSLERITEAAASYPEFSMFGELPCWGFYVRHAEGFVMKNVTIQYTRKEFRAAMIADDVKGLYLDGITIPSYSTLPMIILNNAPGFSTNNIQLPVHETQGIKFVNSSRKNE